MVGEGDCMDADIMGVDVGGTAGVSVAATEIAPSDVGDAEVDDLFLAETTPSLEPLAPRQRRAVAQPLRLENNSHVLCYLYQHTQAGSSSSWQGHTARLCYFLPENWSPAYRYSVFEESFVVCFEEDFLPPDGADQCGGDGAPQLYLARPLHTRRQAANGGEELAEFELVWPMPLDRTLLDTVQRACDVVHPGAKRKPRHALSLSSVHQKLQKLDL
eukprot:1936996-Prymnesium_polylepis.1